MTDASASKWTPRALGRQLARADLSAVRVVIGIAIIWTIFASLNDRFLTSINLTNLMLQVVAVGTISIGVVLVLLLGEIDLSVGAVSGFAAGAMAVLNVHHGWGGWAAMGAALGVGIGVGLVHSIFIAWFRVPAFVVTLAGSLAWSGALLYELGDTGTVNINDDAIIQLTSTFLDAWIGWTAATVIVIGYLAMHLLRRRQRSTAGLPNPSIGALVARVAVLAVAVFGATAVFEDNRGTPLAVVIFVTLVVVFEFVIKRTRFGRHVLAVGGNQEAARRAGIRVQWVRTMVFVLASTLAATGGILAASRLYAVNQSTGGGDLLLLAIAGPVIAGTSLFGGRGSAWSALLGAILIGSISNGMNLLALDSSVKYMITGGVLMLAVTIDALGQRGRVTGR